MACRPDSDPDAPTQYRRVLKKYRNAPAPIIEVHAAHLKIGTTFEHWFYDVRDGWTHAGELKPGSRLRTKDGGTVEVLAVVETGEIRDVYNVQVEEFHTFFVGDEQLSVLVHNQSAKKQLGPVSGALAEVANDESRWAITRIAAGTLVGPVALFDTLPGAIKQAGADARAQIDADVATTNDPVKKLVGTYVAKPLTHVGEAFAQGGNAVGAVAPVLALGETVPAVGAVLANPITTNSLRVAGAVAGVKNAKEQIENGTFSGSDAFFLLAPAAGGKEDVARLGKYLTENPKLNPINYRPVPEQGVLTSGGLRGVKAKYVGPSGSEPPQKSIFDAPETSSKLTVKKAALEDMAYEDALLDPHDAQFYKGSGNYELEFGSGKKYHGKGLEPRMEKSAQRLEGEHGDPVVKKSFTAANNERDALIEEARRIVADGGVEGGRLYNKINSPGAKMGDNQ